MNIKIFNGNNLPCELLLTAKQKTKLRNAFENNMSANIKLFKAQIAEIIPCGSFVVSLWSKIGGLLITVAVPLAKYILASLGITTAALVIDAVIQKKLHGSGTTTLIISNE